MSLENFINKAWDNNSAWLAALKPVAWVLQKVATQRRQTLQQKFQGKSFGAPVIVVGNIALGGSGKTPLLIALLNALKEEGFRPGVVSRGYGGKANQYPMSVTPQSNPEQAGDEPLLIARQSDCPVVVDPHRSAAVNYLLENFDCDVVLSDDGLQHYAMHRDIEIAVEDGQRDPSNKNCFPAGRFREPRTRLSEVDFVIVNQPNKAIVSKVRPTFGMYLQPTQLENLSSGEKIKTEQWQGDKSVHAVAGIGNPQRFADTLLKAGFTVDLHAKPDHHHFVEEDIQFSDNKPVFITAKDAVKCQSFTTENVWVLHVQAELDKQFTDQLIKKIRNF